MSLMKFIKSVIVAIKFRLQFFLLIYLFAKYRVLTATLVPFGFCVSVMYECMYVCRDVGFHFEIYYYCCTADQCVLNPKINF